jgi:hypothetical protein
MSDDEHWLVYTAHAILEDGLAWNIFLKELSDIYTAYTHGKDARLLQSAAPQYGDYAVWQRDTFRPEGRRYRDSLAWWINEILIAVPCCGA